MPALAFKARPGWQPKLEPDKPAPDTVPGRDPNDYEGNGPLKGWLRKGSLLKGDFLDGGLQWAPLADAWGNAFVVLFGRGDRSIYATEKFKGIDPYVNFLEGGRNANRPSYAGHQQDDALAAYMKADAALMAQQGWMPDSANPTDEAKAHGDGPTGYFTFRPLELGGSFQQMWATTRGLRLAERGDHVHQLTGDSYVTEYYPGDDSIAVPLSPTDSDPPGGRGDVRQMDPYIDGVLLQLPVADDQAKDFPGWVFCRVNRWTRTAVVTGLAYGGFGTLDAAQAYGSNLDRLWIAIGKTLLGIVEIIVGVLLLVYGEKATGVGLIVAGVATIVEAWWDFAKTLDKQKVAINNAVGGKATAENAAFGARAQQFQNALRDQHKGAGKGKLPWWLVPAAIIGIKLLA